ncbi:phosphopantetheine-binding protein [Streptomyces sp. NBC_01518]|uniref:phosphopantetheine-binding protein n=1 Tax=Streptomyces sp. NBC_01518 TaxID=2903891 RepID=UPI003863696E
MTPPWDERFEVLLREALRLLEPGDPLLPDLRTADFGLDSLAMVELMLGIEESYGISIPDDMVRPQVFSTPETLWKLISELYDTQGTSSRG